MKMTNIEKLKSEIVNMTAEDLATQNDFICEKVRFCPARIMRCRECKMKWLNSEVEKCIK